MTQDPMRYVLQLEMLEQDGVAHDEHAIALMRSELALAQNAGRFDVVTASDIEVDAIARTTLQEGVTRYEVELVIEERETLGDEGAFAVLCQAFTDALNASYLLRVCEDMLAMHLHSRAPAIVSLRSAA